MKKILLFFPLLLSSLLHSQTLDNTFDSDGKLQLSTTFKNNEAIAVVVQGDGKIVSVGYSNTGIDDDQMLLVRTNTDGSLDTDFDSDGKVYLQINSDRTMGVDLILDEDEKILVAGRCNNASQEQDLFVARFNANGSLDNTFNTDGIFTLESNYETVDVFGITLQSDGKILVSGWAGTDLDALGALVVRINKNGSIDNTFDTDGMNVIETNDIHVGYMVRTLSNNKIIVAGYSTNSQDEWANSVVTLTCLNDDGTIDNSFGTDGIVKHAMTEPGRAYRMEVANDKIFIVGSYGDDITHSFLMKINADGTLDNAFGANGIVKKEYSAEGSEFISLTLASDGKILVCGYVYEELEDMLVTRFNADGSEDLAFSTIQFDLIDGTDWANDVVMQSNGKIVIAGFSDEEVSSNMYNEYFMLLRYNEVITSTNNTLESIVSIGANPNPTRDNCVVSYKLSNAENLSIKLLNAQGTVVKTIVENVQQGAGEYEYAISLSECTAGLYTVMLEGNEVNTAIKVVKE